MFTRLMHAAIAFAVTVAVYQAYVLLAVPFLEPAASGERQEPTASTATRKPYATPHRVRKLLSAYFPVGHWTRAAPPKTLETGSVMIVLDDYEPRDDGQIRVNQCVMLFFPRARVQGEPPPRDAIVLEAPHGAVLQMDEGFRSGLGGLGRIQWGKLVGDIVIRSDMHEPGPHDDLLLTTRDLYMNEDLIRTEEKVEMQVGRHWGRGRVLEMRLVAVESAQAGSAGPQIGAIDSLEILHEVRAQLAPEKMQWLDTPPAGDSEVAPPPIKIASRGRFRFDFANQMASFVDQVQLIQQHASGVRDQLFCDRLNLYLASDEETVHADRQESERAVAVGGKPHAFSGLKPAMIEALGSDEIQVQLDVPSLEATARCRRMRLEIVSRRATFDSQDEVVLTYQGSEIHAPMIRYQAPPRDSTARIGNLLAAGNGWIRALTGDRRAQPFEARWTESLRLERIQGRPVMSLHGRPKLDMVGMGRLWADNMEVLLRERKGDGSEADLLPADVVPERIVASGHVAIESAELSGKVNQLDVAVQYLSSDLVLATADGANASRSRKTFRGPGSGDKRTYRVVGDELNVELAMRQRRPEVSQIEVTGNVDFRETATNTTASEPLVVKADQLRVKDADTPNAEITLQGEAASITASGVTLHANSLRINRGTSRAWIDSPGEMELPLHRDLNGRQLTSPTKLAIRWQNGMELDQDRITFRGRVKARTQDGTLDTEKLVAVLSAPVQFDGATRQGETQLEQIECWEGVRAKFQQRDAGGVTSIQDMTLESIAVNQQTGNITGVGPGRLESVHLSGGSKLGGQVLPSGGRNRPSQRLGYLRVDFRRGVRGNLHQRRVEVFGNTKSVYGPVDAWEQKLEISLRGSPGPGTIWITSEQLGIAESPMNRANGSSRLGAVELFAAGNVTIEGPAGERGTFTARAQRATYDQPKTMFVLEGNGQRPATLIHQEFVGAPFSEQSARKLTYIQSTGEVKLEGIVKGEWNQIDLGRQPQGSGQPASR